MGDILIQRQAPLKAIPQTIIEPKKGWQLIDWRELRDYKDLFYFLVWRDIKVLYKQTVLGFTWAIIRPVFSMIIFTFIFGNLARVSSDGVPYAVFNYVALVPWTYFSTSMTASTMSLVGNTRMLTKIYFPRLVFPMTAVFAKLVDFAIAFLIIGVLMLWYRITPTLNVIFLPLLILLMMLTAAGIGMWLSALAIQYRDIKHAIQFVVQILMYAAPVVWPASLIKERFGETAYMLYGLYPMAGVIEGFRSALLGTNPMPWNLIGMGAIAALIIAISGAFYFRRMERIFADVA
jgi:lipopolysaccharide transport system permease protein